MRKLRTALMIALIIVMTGAAPVMAHDAVSEPYTDGNDYYEDDYDIYYGGSYSFVDEARCKKAKTQAIIEYIYAVYGKNDKFFKGRGECYGYAEMIRQYFGSGYRQRNYGVKATPSSMYKKLKGLKPGTHVRFSSNSAGRNPSHSIVLLKISRKDIWYTHGNVGAHNAIVVQKSSLPSFCATARAWGYKTLVWSREPKGNPPTVSRPDLRISDNRNGTGPHLAWRPVSGAKSYIVYRSTSKKSGFTKIASVKAPIFIDKSTDLYGDVYYKVRAVTSNRKGLTSGTVKANRRLKAPRAYLTVKTDEATGITTYEMTWSPVEGADRYNLYTYGGDDGKAEEYVRTETVYGTSWTHSDNNPRIGLNMLITADSGRSNSESSKEWILYYIPDPVYPY